MKKIIDLYPEAPNEWLWRDHAEDVKREFYPSVSIPAQDEPLWHECTDEEKTAYESEWAEQHPEESGTPDSGEGDAAPEESTEESTEVADNAATEAANAATTEAEELPAIDDDGSSAPQAE